LFEAAGQELAWTTWKANIAQVYTSGSDHCTPEVSKRSGATTILILGNFQDQISELLEYNKHGK